MSTWQTRPLTEETFEDFADVVNPTRREQHCWCLSHRLPARQIQELGGGDRREAMLALSRSGPAPGVVTYRDGEPVGWCSVSPRTAMPLIERSRLIRPVDDVPVWCITCLVVRTGHRRQGVVGHLLQGAVAHAAEHGAPAVEAYPVDPEGRMDTAMAFVGTVAMFTAAGFRQVGATDAVSSRMPRVVMRRDLSRTAA